MKTKSTAAPASRVMHTRLLPAESAAEILARHLGNTPSHWADFLRSDRIESRQGHGCSSFASLEWNGAICYKEHEIFGFIGRENPRAFGFSSDVHHVNIEYAPLCNRPYEVGYEVDYERQGRLLITLEQCCDSPIATTAPHMTVAEARELALSLNRMAEFCETHRFHFLEQDVRPFQANPPSHELIEQSAAGPGSVRATRRRSTAPSQRRGGKK